MSTGANRGIRYTLLPCKLGHLLVAATEAGLCAVQLGADARELESVFRSEHPSTELHRDDAALKAWARDVRALAEGSRERMDVPLDLGGTRFQSRVWSALSQIPRGEVRTYSELAAAVGSPKATRAVAHACARNPVAVVVPCHRVVRRDGGLGGYRWGLERKKRLLGVERARIEWEERS
jgi:AraC family transcriptional regulator of adaptative response/methylated-DNA-[protein]-cysteine methyltransferase